MEIGDYVRIIRANRTYIRKITSIYPFWINKNKKEKTLILDKSFEGCRYSIKENKVLKSSSNIIDLIETGDYVNGCRVTEIKNGKPYHEDYNDPYFSFYFDDIKSIVTKELFEAMEYEVKYNNYD